MFQIAITHSLFETPAIDRQRRSIDLRHVSCILDTDGSIYLTYALLQTRVYVLVTGRFLDVAILVCLVRIPTVSGQVLVVCWCQALPPGSALRHTRPDTQVTYGL